MVTELPLAVAARQRKRAAACCEGTARGIDKALAEGRGLVLLTPHMGCFEITAQAYAEPPTVHGIPSP